MCKKMNLKFNVDGNFEVRTNENLKIEHTKISY
jgi:hypothetical protein